MDLLNILEEGSYAVIERPCYLKYNLVWWVLQEELLCRLKSDYAAICPARSEQHILDETQSPEDLP